MHRLAVFASGTGSNAQKIIDYFRNHSLVHIGIIVSNNIKAGVLDIAKAESIPYILIEREAFYRGHAYVEELKENDIDFIVLAGFLWKVPPALIKAYTKKIINIHPALLPKFGGKGMYGRYVHQAVLDAKETESGITIHYVDEWYDHGSIIFQARCTVDQDDTPETLAQKVHELEHRHYSQVIEQLLKELQVQH